MLSAVMPIGSLVFSVGSAVFPASSFIRDKMGYSSPGWVPGCSSSSCIGFHPLEVSIKLVRVFLGIVTGF